MGKLVFIFFLITTFSFHCQAQNLRRIAKSIEKSEYDKLLEQIDKALEKDSTNFGAMYFKAVYYLHNSLNQYNLDSARIFINQSLEFRSSMTAEQSDDWSKTEFPIFVIDSTKSKIINLSFENALNPPSVGSMQLFLKLFPDSRLEKRVIYLRDSLAFDIALGVDSWIKYQEYTKEYPNSPFTVKALEYYEILLFKDKTKDGSLGSHVQFLREFPKTPYRRESEEMIFKKMTINHEARQYHAFIQQYPNSHLKKKSVDLLYYLGKQKGELNLPELLLIHPNPDSLAKISALEQMSMTPILFDGGFSLMDTSGNVLEHFKYDALDPDYICGNINVEWLRVKAESWIVVNRNGFEIKKNVSYMDEIGKQLILIHVNNESHVYHKSGFRVTSFPVYQVKMIYDQWIAFESNKKWGIMTFSGEVILQPKFDNLEMAGSFVVVTKDGKYDLMNQKTISKLSSNQEFQLPYTDFEVLGDTLFLGFEGDKECLIDQDLEVLLPLEDQSIYPSKAIWYVKKVGGYQIFDKPTKKLMESTFSAFHLNESWLGLKREGKWALRSISDSIANITSPLDSIHFINYAVCYIERRDSSFLFFYNGATYWLKPDQTFTLIKPQDDIKHSSQHFILLSTNDDKTILNTNGEVLFDGKVDDVLYLNDSSFIVKSKGKYGIYSIGNGFVQHATYDLINEQDGLALLVKNNLIGCIDLTNNTIIPAMYEERIERFSKYYQVSKNGLTGVLDADNHMIVPIENKELLSWNDSSYWSKPNDEWLLKTYQGDIILNHVLSLSKWNATTIDDLYLFMKEDKYGIIDPKKGILIPPMYNEIINVGTTLQPIFFAEQHLETADLFVVSYFNALGKTIKSQAYRPSEYDLIYCDQ
ncbi:MAG: hypothetical protein ACJA08_000729 [Cyclobacteriaceae bacterium]